LFKSCMHAKAIHSSMHMHLRAHTPATRVHTLLYAAACTCTCAHTLTPATRVHTLLYAAAHACTCAHTLTPATRVHTLLYAEAHTCTCAHLHLLPHVCTPPCAHAHVHATLCTCTPLHTYRAHPPPSVQTLSCTYFCTMVTLCVCAFVCVCVCLCVCVYVCVCVSMLQQGLTFSQVVRLIGCCLTFQHACVPVHTHLCARAHRCTHTHTHTYTLHKDCSRQQLAVCQ
jgi:hypothetical protein